VVGGDRAFHNVQFSAPPEQITTDLLQVWAEFFGQASPTVDTELRQFLTDHGHHGGLGRFLDALGFTTLNYTALDNNPGGASR
jgi:hypothetical protein